MQTAGGALWLFPSVQLSSCFTTRHNTTSRPLDDTKNTNAASYALSTLHHKCSSPAAEWCVVTNDTEYCNSWPVTHQSSWVAYIPGQHLNGGIKTDLCFIADKRPRRVLQSVTFQIPLMQTSTVFCYKDESSRFTFSAVGRKNSDPSHSGADHYRSHILA